MNRGMTADGFGPAGEREALAAERDAKARLEDQSESPTLSMDTSQRLSQTCLIGVYAAVNAIPDAYLLVDAPDCAHLKGQFIHGNHDWMSTLVSISGYHRLANTALHCWKVIDKRDETIVARLRKMGEFAGSGLVFMTSMPMATIVGVDYARLCHLAQDASGTDTFHIVDKAIDGDWMDGYAEVLLTLAKGMAVDRGPAAPQKDPRKVAIVGYFMDRNEEDHQGNLRELRRLLAGLGLELSTVWAGGEPWAQMKRGVQEAGTILSFPYARRAAQTLGRRLKTPVVECRLPFGLKATVEWLEQLGATFDRAEQAGALIAAELKEIMPRLEFVVPYQFLHRRLLFVGDPFHSEGFLEIAADLGCRVPFLAVTARRHNAKSVRALRDAGALAETTVLIDPRMWGFQERFSPVQRSVDLIVSCNTTTSDAEQGYLEFGFPSYERHALYDRPFLGFRGMMALVDDMARELRRVDQARLRRERNRHGEGGGAGETGPLGLSEVQSMRTGG
jgi:nitrogenase molybdenum-iron protein alpha/beta subunit